MGDKGSGKNGQRPALMVLGRDDGGKAHGSWFGEEDAPLAEKAAGLMGMVAVRVDTDAFAELAAKLPHGKVFASGKAFVPFVRDTLYRSIADQLPEDVRAMLGKPRETPVPVETTGSAPMDQHPLPRGWDVIAVGDLVLATLGSPDGWFECVVAEAHDDDLFTLRYRDFPDWEPFVRRREHLALINPNFATGDPA